MSLNWFRQKCLFLNARSTAFITSLALGGTNSWSLNSCGFLRHKRRHEHSIFGAPWWSAQGCWFFCLKRCIRSNSSHWGLYHKERIIFWRTSGEIKEAWIIFTISVEMYREIGTMWHDLQIKKKRIRQKIRIRDFNVTVNLIFACLPMRVTTATFCGLEDPRTGSFSRSTMILHCRVSWIWLSILLRFKGVSPPLNMTLTYKPVKTMTHESNSPRRILNGVTIKEILPICRWGYVWFLWVNLTDLHPWEWNTQPVQGHWCRRGGALGTGASRATWILSRAVGC